AILVAGTPRDHGEKCPSSCPSGGFGRAGLPAKGGRVRGLGCARAAPAPAAGAWLASGRPIQSSRETWLVDAAATRTAGAPARTDGGDHGDVHPAHPSR